MLYAKILQVLQVRMVRGLILRLGFIRGSGRFTTIFQNQKLFTASNYPRGLFKRNFSGIVALVLLQKIYIFTVPYFIMVAKKFLLLVTFLLLSTHLLIAATFTVTSNADAGPGTLREALTNAAANGITTQDIIRFALPGSLVSDRIIRLKTQLPLVSSNLIIDGTTQAGSVFGVSDAKVIIEPETSPANFSGLNINGDVYNGYLAAKNIEIYGLYIRNFAKINNLATPDLNQGSGIYIFGEASSIKIGAPGKGNVICGNIYGIINNSNYYYNAASDIQIQSNIIGLLDDGYTAASNITGVNLVVSGNVTIGGTAVNMGNVISANVTGVSIVNGYYYNNYSVAINIQNNKIGTDVTGKFDFKNLPLFQQSAFIKTYGIFMTTPTTSALIKNNQISGQRYYGIYIENSTYTITGNKIGTDITGALDLGNGEGIMAGTNSSGTIGGTTTADKNLIGFNTYGIEVLNSIHTLITQNSIFCNKDYGINVSSVNYQVPFVKVISFSAAKVSGVATPNSKIELFYADACGYTNCQGKTYITTVNSNASGAWTYNGTISSPVIATATDGNNNTSPFSSLEIQDNDIEVKQFTCDYKGSVTIKPAFTGLLFHWDKKEQNGSLTPIADTKSVSNLQPGTYQLTVQYPGGCQKSTKLFIINDQRIKIQNILPPTPECRQKLFPIDVNFQGGTGIITFAWKNAAGDVKLSDKQGLIPGGTYTLTISDEAGCSVTTAPFTIVPKPGPDYDATYTAVPARCGEKNGSISGITYYIGIGPITYKWRNQAGAVVGTGATLTGVVSGLYTLEVADQSQCSPYTRPNTYFYVPEVNSITISGGFVTPTTCGNSNGTITGVNIFGNFDIVQWYAPNGTPLPTTLNNYLNRSNLSPGTYRLYAKRTVIIDGQQYVCEQNAYFQVNALAPETFSYNPNIIATTCGLNNGSINLQFNGNVIPQSFQWINASNTPQSNGNSNQITDLAPGFYSVMVTDVYGCPSTLGPFEVKNTPLLAFADNNNPVATNDECDQNLGHIDGVAITGGVAPYTYKWTNQATGQDVGGNTPTLNGIGQSTYRLVVTDATTCAIPLVIEHIAVGNHHYEPPSPVLTDKRICSPEVVNLAVISPVAGTYKLYATNNSTEPLQTNTKGSFNVSVTETTDYYVAYNIGTCISARTKVHVEVVLIDVKFGNAFTPNQDGINDYWKITGLEKFPGSLVQVFTRGGQKVFESKEYATPFEGRQGTTPLPAGVYYYIINLNTPCDLLSGSVTIIR
jgi:gliding motility-associated-like protein